MTNLRLMDVKVVTAKTTYGMLGKGQFPKPLKISEQLTRWVESDIDAWI